MSSSRWIFVITILFKSLLAQQKYNISRHYQGDLFTLPDHQCRPNDCHGNGRRASSIPWVRCQCQCLPSSPVFRQDVGQCVGTINECGEHMAVFVNPAFTESIPFVVLPEDNGVLYPSAEISLTDPTFTAVGSNLCVLTYLKILRENGWEEIEDLRINSEPSFKAVGEGGKLFLQFSGDDLMRRKLSAGLVNVDVSCQREPGESSSKVASKYCIIFRVADVAVVNPLPIPPKSNDFVIIGLCAGLLGVTYVGAMLIYLLVRWQKRHRILRKGTNTISDENGGVDDKESPYEFVMDSDENSVNRDIADETSTSVTDASQTSCVERAPLTGLQLETSTVLQMRRRLVFDPSFLDLDSLDSPPPAAVEFLSRIREMIGIARNRIRSSRFLPALGAISEEVPRTREGGSEEFGGCDNEAFENDDQIGIEDDDRFTFLARIPEDNVLTDSYDGLYDFESFRLEMVKKMQKKRREQMKKNDEDEDEEWSVEGEPGEEIDNLTGDSLDPLQGNECETRFSRSQMLKKVYEDDKTLYDVPTVVDKRVDKVSTYLFGETVRTPEPTVSKISNGISKNLANFSPPKLDKVRRKVFGDKGIVENGVVNLVEDHGYHSSDSESSNKLSNKKNNSSLKTLRRLLALKSPSSTEPTVVDTPTTNHEVTLGQWLSVGGGEELVINCDGLKDDKNQAEFSAVSFVSTMNLEDEVESSESDYADSLEGTPVLR